MDTNSLPINRFKAQLSKFSGNISKPYGKTTRRFFREMLYGIQASQDIKLSNIGRSLQKGVALIKTEDRVSRNLSKEDFSDHINEVAGEAKIMRKRTEARFFNFIIKVLK